VATLSSSPRRPTAHHQTRSPALLLEVRFHAGRDMRLYRSDTTTAVQRTGLTTTRSSNSPRCGERRAVTQLLLLRRSVPERVPPLRAPVPVVMPDGVQAILLQVPLAALRTPMKTYSIRETRAIIIILCPISAPNNPRAHTSKLSWVLYVCCDHPLDAFRRQP